MPLGTKIYAQNLKLIKKIHGAISPKSIVYNGNGIFSAQNMMYRHTVTLYNSNGDLLKTIEDKVDLKSYGFTEYKEDSYYGAPVESCFSDRGKYLWVSNYSMLGSEFKNEGCDACSSDSFDPSFVYKINTLTYEIENVIKVGSVPKYLALNERSNLMLVTNWSSSDVSIIDLKTEKEIKRIKIGRHPRGVDITKDGKKAYITIMGGYDIVELDLQTFEKTIIKAVGKAPRHLVLGKDDEFLYCTINSDNKILKLNLKTKERQFCKVKSVPRTMVLSANQKYIYVVNYFEDSFQKVEVETMTVIETKKTGHHPIGISANWETSEIWVACYTGVIQIFKDQNLEKEVEDEKLLVSNANDRLKHIPQYSFNDIVRYNDEKQKTEKIALKIQQEKEFLALAEKQKYIDQIEFNRLTKIKEANKAKLIKEKNKVEKEQLAKLKIEEKNSNAESNCKYHLIIGSFGKSSNAVGLVVKMKAKGYPAKIIPSKNGNMSMVSIQCFNSVASVSQSKSKILRDTKQKGWVYAPK